MQGLFTRNGSHTTALLILAMTALSGAASAQKAPALRATNQSLLALHDDAGTSLMAAAAIGQLDRAAALAATPLITEGAKGGAAPASADATSIADVVGGVSDGKFAMADHFFDGLGSLPGSASSNSSVGNVDPFKPYRPGIVAHSDQLRPDNPDLPNIHGVPGSENSSGKHALRNSVPAPGPAALLIIAGGASSLRRRRRR